jgi:AraC family transcriptional regulator
MLVPGSPPTAEKCAGDELRRIVSNAPGYSAKAVGNCLTFENYVSFGVVEVPEMEVPAHVLILRTESPSVIEWKEDGRERRVKLDPGSVSLLPAGSRRAARVFRPQPGEASILQIRPSFLQRSVGEIARGGRVQLGQHMDLRDSQIARLIESLRADIASGSPTSRLFGESVAAALSVHIAQQYSITETRLEEFRGGLSPARLKRVLEYIDVNLADSLDLDKLAEVAGLNLYHFARGFRQSTGLSPHQHVLRKRIERAKEFLRDPRLSVLEASARTGFVDQSHFSKVFRRITGVAPSAYRA